MPPILHMFAMLPALAASCLISAIWQGMVLAGCVTVCLHLLPEITAAIRSMIWTAVFVLVLALHVAAISTNHSSALRPSLGSAIHLDFRWSVLIAFLWILFSLIRGLHLVMSAIRLRRIAKKAVPFGGAASCSALLNHAHRPAELYTSTDVDSPSVIGFVWPRILIPASLLARLSASQLEQIVLHEMEHLRRGDDWINLLQKFSLVLFPLNPVLQWIERRLCMERELACDERVLRFTQAPKAYATCLTNLAEHSMRQGRTSLALRAWERQSELRSRVHRILRRPTVSMARGPAKLVAGSLVLGILGGAASLSNCPQLVSFLPPAVPQYTSAVPQTGTPRTDFQDVVFHPGSAHATVMNAVVPERRNVQRTPVRTHLQRSKGKRRDHRRAVLSTWFVMTDWDGLAAPLNLKFALVENFRPSSYSATRPAAGWVVFQL